MPRRRSYQGGTKYYVGKLGRVMERFGVPSGRCDYTISARDAGDRIAALRRSRDEALSLVGGSGG